MSNVDEPPGAPKKQSQQLIGEIVPITQNNSRYPLVTFSSRRVRLLYLYCPGGTPGSGSGANWGVCGRGGNLDIGDGANSMREDACHSSRIYLARK
jgi:hypothetical protein